MISVYAIPGIYRNECVDALEIAGLKPRTQLIEKTRKREIAEERQYYFYYLINLFDYTLTEAGKVFGMDHATAIHAVKKISNLREVDPLVLSKTNQIESSLDKQHIKMNYRKYFALEKQIKSHGFDVDRKDLIYSYTNGKKESLRALSSREYIEFTDWLIAKFKLKDTSWRNTPANKMRRKIWSLFVIKMGYSEADYKVWLVTKSKFKKPIGDHTHGELVELVSQADKVYQSYLNEINKA